jgi:hypothetical protein
MALTIDIVNKFLDNDESAIHQATQQCENVIPPRIPHRLLKIGPIHLRVGGKQHKPGNGGYWHIKVTGAISYGVALKSVGTFTAQLVWNIGESMSGKPFYISAWEGTQAHVEDVCL